MVGSGVRAGRQFRQAPGVDPAARGGSGSARAHRSPFYALFPAPRRQPRGPPARSPPADTAPAATNRFAVCTAATKTIRRESFSAKHITIRKNLRYFHSTVIHAQYEFKLEHVYWKVIVKVFLTPNAKSV